MEAPIEELAPKDALSASEIDEWNLYRAPEPGYSERVYFARLRADALNDTCAMLRSADGKRGFAVNFSVTGLPRFILWKNTAAESDGYVTGLEPATNFPNQRSFEAGHGRLVEIGPGNTKSFRVSLNPLVDEEAVTETSKRIKTLGEEPATIHRQPRPGWSPGA